MSFKMFPEQLAGDNRTFIAQDVREVLNRAGIKVVDDKFQGVAGVSPPEFIIWDVDHEQQSYKLEVSPRRIITW